MRSDPPSPTPDTPGETFESVPWESLAGGGGSGHGRRWMVAAGAVLAIGLLVPVVRSMAGSDPTPIERAEPVTSASAAPATTVDTLPAVVTEADLMAVDAAAMERSVAAAAEAAVTEYFSGETGGLWSGFALAPGQVTFVELARALSAERLAAGRFRVTVAVSVLDGGEDGVFTRRPLRAAAIVVESDGGMVRPVDLPTPADVPIGAFVEPVVVEVAPDPAVVAAARASAARWGEPGSEVLSYGMHPSGDIRVVLEVTDAAGAVWPVAVVAGPDGAIRPPG